ncbi:hypothetical protein [Robiginitomaculum antarcticum]|uniref:hypothetical protein n=1 Tax=Robiginitomaculum antarcticum TaxID=437507 RepID=UPI0003A4DDFE|nr:hypothetical protein [Robiginitomaculum antarcticum]
MSQKPPPIPRDKTDNFTPEMIQQRDDFITAQTGVLPRHIDGCVYMPMATTKATVLAGEISLSSAVVGDYGVESHDAHGRNRP